MKVLASLPTAGLVLAALAAGALRAQQPATPDRPVEPAARYFLGVQCEPAPEYVKKHVLNTDHGLVVRVVLPDSPAAKAGVERGAILLRANDKPLTTPAVLRQVVQQSGGKEVKLLLWQQGKKQQLAVKPNKLDAIFGGFGQFPFEAMQPPPGMPEPPMFVAGFWGLRGKIPADVAIRIEKPAGKPAQVRVQRGKEVWEAPLDELNKLPREPRNWVRRLLSRGIPGFFPGVFPEEFSPPSSAFPEPALPPSKEVREQLNQLQQRLQRLERQLNLMRSRINRLERR